MQWYTKIHTYYISVRILLLIGCGARAIAKERAFMMMMIVEYFWAQTKRNNKEEKNWWFQWSNGFFGERQVWLWTHVLSTNCWWYSFLCLSLSYRKIMKRFNWGEKTTFVSNVPTFQWTICQNQINRFDILYYNRIGCLRSERYFFVK